MKNEIKISLKTFIILIIIGIILIFAAIYFLLKNQNNNFEKENVTRELSNISEEDNKLAISIENKNENENEKTAENVVKGETVQINISKDTNEVLNEIERIFSDFNVDIKHIKRPKKDELESNSEVINIVGQYSKKGFKKNELLKNISAIPNVTELMEE